MRASARYPSEPATCRRAAVNAVPRVDLSVLKNTSRLEPRIHRTRVHSQACSHSSHASDTQSHCNSERGRAPLREQSRVARSTRPCAARRSQAKGSGRDSCPRGRAAPTPSWPGWPCSELAVSGSHIRRWHSRRSPQRTSGPPPLLAAVLPRSARAPRTWRRSWCVPALAARTLWCLATSLA